MPTERETLPDLSALDREARISTAVAKTQGWRWERRELYGEWAFLLVTDDWKDGVWGTVWEADGEYERDSLPDFLTDPAAWGALMETEFSGWETARFGAEFRHQVRWHTHTAHGFKKGPWAASLPAAVCEGVLAKYGVEVPS